MASLSSILAASFLFSVLSPSISAPPTNPSPSKYPKAISAPPAWTASETTSCSNDFSHGRINPLDCHEAFNKLPSGGTPIQFGNNVPWPYNVPQGLPLMVTHKTCAMKITASGRSATSLNTMLRIPDHIREMAAWITDQCVRRRRNGGFVTRQLINTKAYLQNTNNVVDFKAGFPPSTTFFSLLIWYRPLDFDRYNPGNHDPEVGYELVDSCIGAAEAFPRRSTERAILVARSRRIETALNHQERNPDVLVNWWDFYRPDYPEAAMSLAGGGNLTSALTCLIGNCSALPQQRSATSR